jgi:MFS family permease
MPLPQREPSSQTGAGRQEFAARVYPWLAVAMLWAVCLLNYADRQSIYSVFPLLKVEFRLTDIELGVIAGSFMWVYAAFGPAAGWLADRVSGKWLVLGALAFWSAMTAMTAIADGYHMLAAVRALGGLGEAFYFPAAMTLIARYHGTETRSRAMAIHQSAVYTGTVAGGALSAIIAERAGWREGFVLFGLVGVVVAAVLSFTLREPGASLDTVSDIGQPADFWTSIREVLTNRKVLLLTGVFAGANFVAVVFLVWLPTFLRDKFHMGLASAGLNSVLSLQLASIAGVLLAGFAADRSVLSSRWTRRQVQGCGLVMGVPCLFLLGRAPTVGTLLAAMIGFGMCKGIYDSNIWASLYDVVPVARRGVAAGLMNSIGWLGAGAAPIAAAAGAKRFGFSACLSATSVIYLVLAVPMLWPARASSRMPAA